MNDNNASKYLAHPRYAAGKPGWDVEDMLTISDPYDDDDLAAVMESLDVDEYVLYELVPRKIVMRRTSITTEDIK